MSTSQVVRIQCRNHQELGRENERQSLPRAGSCLSLRKRPRGAARMKHEIQCLVESTLCVELLGNPNPPAARPP